MGACEHELLQLDAADSDGSLEGAYPVGHEPFVNSQMQRRRRRKQVFGIALAVLAIAGVLAYAGMHSGSPSSLSGNASGFVNFDESDEEEAKVIFAKPEPEEQENSVCRGPFGLHEGDLYTIQKLNALACKGACLKMGFIKCKGYETGPNDHCELWKYFPMVATKPRHKVKGFSCAKIVSKTQAFQDLLYRYAAPDDGRKAEVRGFQGTVCRNMLARGKKRGWFEKLHSMFTKHTVASPHACIKKCIELGHSKCKAVEFNDHTVDNCEVWHSPVVATSYGRWTSHFSCFKFVRDDLTPEDLDDVLPHDENADPLKILPQAFQFVPAEKKSSVCRGTQQYHREKGKRRAECVEHCIKLGIDSCKGVEVGDGKHCEIYSETPTVRTANKRWQKNHECLPMSVIQDNLPMADCKVGEQIKASNHMECESCPFGTVSPGKAVRCTRCTDKFKPTEDNSACVSKDDWKASLFLATVTMKLPSDYGVDDGEEATQLEAWEKFAAEHWNEDMVKTAISKALGVPFITIGVLQKVHVLPDDESSDESSDVSSSDSDDDRRLEVVKLPDDRKTVKFTLLIDVLHTQDHDKDYFKMIDTEQFTTSLAGYFNLLIGNHIAFASVSRVEVDKEDIEDLAQCPIQQERQVTDPGKCEPCASRTMVTNRVWGCKECEDGLEMDGERMKCRLAFTREDKFEVSVQVDIEMDLDDSFKDMTPDEKIEALDKHKGFRAAFAMVAEALGMNPEGVIKLAIVPRERRMRRLANTKVEYEKLSFDANLIILETADHNAAKLEAIIKDEPAEAKVLFAKIEKKALEVAKHANFDVKSIAINILEDGVSEDAALEVADTELFVFELVWAAAEAETETQDETAITKVRTDNTEDYVATLKDVISKALRIPMSMFAIDTAAENFKEEIGALETGKRVVKWTINVNAVNTFDKEEPYQETLSKTEDWHADAIAEIAKLLPEAGAEITSVGAVKPADDEEPSDAESSDEEDR